MKNIWRNFLCRTGIFLVSLLGASNLFAAVGFTISPNTISNTYFGPVTLTVTGITAGATVVVQKFADFDTNGVIDPGDALIQQFTLTDGQAGQVIGGVTNISVPGDTDTIAGHITTPLYIQSDFMQFPVGKYLYKLSSPTGLFAPITNSFSITNFPFPQKFTGSVSSGSAIPYAIVMLFPPPRGGHHDGPGNPEFGTIANSAGNYSIATAPGTYTLVAFKTNFVGDFSTAPVATLAGGATSNVNLTLTAATLSISGKLENSTNSNIGIPGTLMAAQTQTEQIGVGFTDTNGNYSIKVTSGQWSVQPPSGIGGGAPLHGYVSLQNGVDTSTTSGSTTGVNVLLPEANSLFYGKVLDGNGNPLPFGVDVAAQDQPTNFYQSDGFTDVNGNYAAGALGDLGTNDPWQVSAKDQNGLTNYIFSQPDLGENGDTNILAGQVVQANITALLATNFITGHVETSSGNPITNVQVQAYATLGVNNVNFNISVDTDKNGNYALAAAFGYWNVDLNCNNTGNGDSLDEVLGANNYLCPAPEVANIDDADYDTNFTVQLCGAVVVTTTNLPDGQVGNFYDNFLSASSCNGNFTWTTNAGGSLPDGLTLQSSGEINGTPTTIGTNNFSVHVVDGNNNFTNQALSIIIAGAPLSITTSSPLPEGGNGSFYSQTIQASGGQPPYGWSIPNYSVNPPPNLNLSLSGVLSGTLATNGTYNFYVRVTDATNGMFDQEFSLTITNLPLQVFTFQLPNATAGVSYNTQLVATNGQPPYAWGYASGSAAVPANLSLAPGGLISGIPLTNGLFSFIVQVTDADFATSTRMLGLIVNPKPSLGSSKKLSGTQFQFLLSGASNQNYTVQVSTNLSSVNWTTLLTTNNTTANSSLIIDPQATNAHRYYRVLIGP